MIQVGDQFMDPYGPKRGKRFTLEVVKVRENKGMSDVIAVRVDEVARYESHNADIVWCFSSKYMEEQWTESK